LVEKQFFLITDSDEPDNDLMFDELIQVTDAGKSSPAN